MKAKGKQKTYIQKIILFLKFTFRLFYGIREATFNPKLLFDKSSWKEVSFKGSFYGDMLWFLRFCEWVRAEAFS